MFRSTAETVDCHARGTRARTQKYAFDYSAMKRLIFIFTLPKKVPLEDPTLLEIAELLEAGRSPSHSPEHRLTVMFVR